MSLRSWSMVLVIGSALANQGCVVPALLGDSYLSKRRDEDEVQRRKDVQSAEEARVAARTQKQEADARRKPSIPVHASYDLKEAATFPADKAPEHICETLKRRSAWDSELPDAEHERFKAHRTAFGDERGFKIANEDQDWSMVIQYRHQANEAWLRDLANEYRGDLNRPDDVPTERLRVAVAVWECAPSSKYEHYGHAKEILAARDEKARCDADPACVAQREKDYLARLQQDICASLAGERSAKEDARAEWKNGREVSVVSVEALGRSRTLMLAEQQRGEDSTQEWESLTGKKFNPKKMCR